jgi:hypothetical protein
MNDAKGASSLPIQERKLITAAAQGAEADFRTHPAGQPPTIRAATLQALCTGVNAEWPVQDEIRVTGALVQGHLDLSGAHLAHGIRFRDCVFEDPVNLRQARAEHALEWEGGWIPGILADRLECDADLTIQGVEIDGTISLHWADVRGDLRLTDSHLAQPGGRVIEGSDLRVGGTLFLDGTNFCANGEVCLRSAHVHGDVDCRHARFDHPDGLSINAAHLVVDGELLCEQGFTSNGEVLLQWAQVQRLRATGGTFASATTHALRADALRALAGVYLDRGFHATATVRLVGANITGELCCTKGCFDNPSEKALDAERIVADDVYLDRGFVAHGEVRFTDADIKRQFNATNGEFRNEAGNGYALDADGLKCGGEVYLNEGFHATGVVSLTGASIDSELNCTGASFANPDGYALFADGLTTPGTVYLDHGFRAIGEVRFARATVGRQLMCSAGVFDNPNGIALDLSGAICHGDVLLNSGSDGFRATGEVRIWGCVIIRDLDLTGALLLGSVALDARGIQVGGRLILRLERPPSGVMDMSFGQVRRLDDTLESWPEGKYTLSGLAYGVAADSPMTVEQRIRWLMQTRTYAADAYQQLAQSYRVNGNEEAARRILIERERDLRRRGGLRRPAKAWSRFLDFTVRNGYRLYRPFIALLVLWLIGWWLYAWAQSAHLIFSTDVTHTAAPACVPGYPCFYPIVYSAQLLIPVVDLREATYWLPDATIKPWGLLMMVFTWLMIVVGWLSGTAIVAGITRFFSNR